MNFKTKLALGTLVGSLLLSGCSDDNNNGGIIGGPFLVAPTAVNDAYSSRGNAQITPAASVGVLANDTPNTGVISAHTAPGHGTLVLNADGSFTYTPTSGFQGTDTFTYTLTNSSGSSTATVTLTISGIAYYVNNQAAAGGDGSQAHPFQTLSTATTAVSGINGAMIFVFRGDGTSTGLDTAVALGQNQTLSGLNETAGKPVLSGLVTLGTNSTVNGLTLNSASGDAIKATNVGSVTLTNLTVSNVTSNGLSATNISGSCTFSGLTFTNIGKEGIDLSLNSVNVNVTASNITATNTGLTATAGLTGNFCLANITGTTVFNSTWNQLSLTNIGLSSVGSGFEWVATDASNTTVNVTNSMVNNAQGFGVGLEALNNSHITSVVNALNVTNCASQGVAFQAYDSGQLLARVSNSRLLGNFSSLAAQDNSGSSSNPATVGLRIVGNIGDTYDFAQANNAALKVENFTGLSTDNTGTSNVMTGSVTNAPIGSLGIP